MRAFLLTDTDGQPVAEGVEFASGGRAVSWLDENNVAIYGAPITNFDDAWELVWVSGELTTPQLPRYSNVGSGPLKIEGFAETLADLRTRPGMWKALAVAEDELAGHALRVALTKAAEEEAPGEHFGFGCGEIDGHPFTVVGCFEPTGEPSD